MLFVCFLLLLLSFYFFVHSFIDNYVSCHVFLVSSGIHQLSSRAIETKTVCKEAKAKNRKQRTHRRWAFRWESSPARGIFTRLGALNYHLFWSMHHPLVGQRFRNVTEIQKWIDNFIVSKLCLFCKQIRNLSERWK